MAAQRALKLSVINRTLICISVILLCYFCEGVSSCLKENFYAKSCPNVSSIVAAVVSQAVKAETRMAASLLRLHFHDCFVQGCDGSLLLDGPMSEKFERPNNNSLRGFDVVDDIKSAVESACSGTVSCADILTLAAQAAVSLVSGPSWKVRLGRRDSTTKPSPATVLASLPGPRDTLANITTKFGNVGLSRTDVVVLSGAHTIGFARCTTFKDRLYNFSGTGKPDPSLDPTYRQTLENTCPEGGDMNALAPLDRATPNSFNSDYYSNLQANRGLLQSDQELYATRAKTAPSVDSFASDQRKFFKHFVHSMVRMGNISPLTGSDGEIRLNCRVVNS